jgi:hypothetical protein
MHDQPRFPKYRAFNKRLAVRITKIVGSMTFAYFCVCLALVSLPAVLSTFARFRNTFPAWLTDTSIISLVAWIAQTFLQLVLLGIILVGQKVDSAASEQRTSAVLANIADALDIDTAGGIAAVQDSIISEIKSLKRRPDGTTEGS